MADSPAIQLAKVIDAADIGKRTASHDWPIKVGPLPTTPDQVIGCVDAPGLSPNPKWALDYPAVQILVRTGTFDYQAGYDKAREIKDALLGMDSVTIGDDRWVSTTMLGDISYLGPDENQRPTFALNFRAIIESKPAADSFREQLPIN